MAQIPSEPCPEWDYVTQRAIRTSFKVLNIINPTVSQANYSCYCSIMVDLTMGYGLGMIEYQCKKRGFIVSLRQLQGLRMALDEQIRLDTRA